MHDKPVLSRRVLFLIFTVSGFSGLIYESIWSQYLKLFLGHAAYAQTLVLAIFMGGMALGAWLVARATLKLRNLLLAYAAVEALTGLIALLFHPIYTGATSFAFDSAIPALDSAFFINTFKWSLAGALILPQSILLGSTFPLISAGVIRRFPNDSGETLAMLYFTNSLGAAVGVLASGFFLIGRVGLPGTVITAGILNILLALAVWMLARDSEEPRAPAPTESRPQISAVVRWVCLAAFLAGMAAFMYEIAWIRMLSLVLGSSTHAFELMLSAFILGLALGGFWIRRRIGGFERPRLVLAGMFAIMAVLAALTLPAYGFTFDIMSSTMRMFDATEPGYAGFNVVSHAIAAGMMLPTTVVAGMTLPLMTHYLLKEHAGEQAIGKVYAANTVGAIAGVLLAVHVLLPHFTTKGAVIAGALIQLAIAALFLRGEGGTKRSPVSYGVLASSAIAVVAIATLVHLDPLRMASGVYRRGFATLPAASTVTFLRDGKTATITLAEQRGTVVIATNGKPDAAINMTGTGVADPDEITMTLAGGLPMLLHPNPRRVANIGIGSGLSSHVALTSRRLEVLDSIEIERAIVEAARRGFESRVTNLFHDPRSHIHIEDAKTFFATVDEPYDVIISEPSNPWVSGVASLFSGEFYKRINRSLTADGLLVQWVQIYETDNTVVASIVNALSPNFADYAIYNTDDADLLIIATPNGTVPLPRPEALEGELAKELAKVGISSVDDIAIRLIGTKRLLDPLFLSYPVPANSDYFPFVDQQAPKMRFLRRSAFSFEELHLRAVPIMEMLGEAAPPMGFRLSMTESFLLRREMVLRAWATRSAVETGDVRNLPTTLALDILSLSSPASACAHESVRNAWVQSVQSIAASTTPFLTASDLSLIWARIRGSACQQQIGAAQRVMVDFLEAVAQRNGDLIVERGTNLLNDGILRTEDGRADILLAVTAALLGQDKTLEAATLLQANLSLVESRLNTDLPMRLTQATIIARLTSKRASRPRN